MRFLVLIVILISLLRLYPILTNEYCFSDDCTVYYDYILGNLSTPELTFMALVWFMHGILLFDEVLIMRLFMFFLPICFTFGLYKMLKDKVKNSTMSLILIAINLSLSMNLFWFVMVKNGLMLVFFTFFLHYYLEKKYDTSLIFLMLSALSHSTFVFLTIPLIAYMVWKKETYYTGVAFITILVTLYYILSPQAALSGEAGLTNLNYMFVDVAFLFFAVMSVKKPLSIYVIMFIACSLFALLTLPFLVQSWRMFVLLNFPVYLAAMSFVESKSGNKWFKIILIIYVLYSWGLFFTYITTIQSLTFLTDNGYVYLYPS